MSRNILMELYERLLAAYGPQRWWPADTPFEVIVGAVLTQNTSWRNVAKAVACLKEAALLDLESIAALPVTELAGLIRSSGFFNVKARRLRNLCCWLQGQGGMDAVARRRTEPLRRQLLAVNGIGPETADDILLYAFERPVFVVDNYTRRLLRDLGLAEGGEDYETLRRVFESRLPPDPVLYNEYHALIVRHAKEKCVGAAGCRHCAVERPLRRARRLN